MELGSPVRDPHEDEECWLARMQEHRDLEHFESAAGNRLIKWRATTTARMNLDAPTEVDVKKGGAWVPVDLFVTFKASGVDPGPWADDE